MNQVGHMSFEGTIVCGCRWVIQEYRVGEVREIGKGFGVVWEPRSYHPRAWACGNLLCWIFNRTLGEECACFHLPLLQRLLCPLSWGSLHWKEGMQLLPQFWCLALSLLAFAELSLLWRILGCGFLMFLGVYRWPKWYWMGGSWSFINGMGSFQSYWQLWSQISTKLLR